MLNDQQAIFVSRLAKMHVQPWLVPKVDSRKTCYLRYHRLTEILCPPRRYRLTCSLMPKGVCINLHYSGRVPEAEILPPKAHIMPKLLPKLLPL